MMSQWPIQHNDAALSVLVGVPFFQTFCAQLGSYYAKSVVGKSSGSQANDSLCLSFWPRAGPLTSACEDNDM